MPELILDNINKIYPGGFQAVYDFNIEIEHGEFVVLVGPSGCGKSTVLRMIAGLEEISDGDMILSGERINKVAPADRDISMVFQNYALYGHMSVYDNMGFSQTVRHEDPDVIHEKVMKAAGIVELKDQLNRYPKNLSGGQRQRVALGRSIVSFANIILMDEPLSNLDAKLRAQSRREIAKLAQQLGNTFIYVTHDQTEALTLADRIVVMDGGRVQQIDTPVNLYNWPENMFVGGFIGSPPMNLIRGKVEDGRFIAPGMNLGIPQVVMGEIYPNSHGDVFLGFRPEHFTEDPKEFAGVVRAEVRDREYLGDHWIFHLQTEGTSFVARLSQEFSQFDKSTVEIFLDMSRVHLFDSESESRIRREGEK